MFAIIVGELGTGFFSHFFKLAWKTTTPLALVTAKHHSDLLLLCIDNQHLFLQHHAAIFIPLSGGKTDCLDHLPHQICIESYSTVNLCHVFYLKAYLRHTEPFRMKPDGSNVLCVAKGHMSLGCLGVQLLQP